MSNISWHIFSTPCRPRDRTHGQKIDSCGDVGFSQSSIYAHQCGNQINGSSYLVSAIKCGDVGFSQSSIYAQQCGNQITGSDFCGDVGFSQSSIYAQQCGNQITGSSYLLSALMCINGRLGKSYVPTRANFLTVSSIPRAAQCGKRLP